MPLEIAKQIIAAAAEQKDVRLVREQFLTQSAISVEARELIAILRSERARTPTSRIANSSASQRIKSFGESAGAKGNSAG